MRRLVASLSLRQRHLLLLCLVALPGIAFAVFLADIRLQEQTEQIENNVGRLARLGAAEHERVIEGARMLLDAVARAQAVEGISGSKCSTYLEGWVDRYPAFTSLTLFDDKGQVVCSNRTKDPDLPTVSENRDWLDEARARNDFVLGDYALGQSGKPLLVASRPVLDRQGERIGFVALGIELRWLEFVASTVKLPENGTITAIDRKGIVLSHNDASPPLSAGPRAVPAPPSQTARLEMGRLGNGTLRATDAAGNPRVYGFHNTRSGGLVVAVGLPRFREYLGYGEALLHTLAAPLATILLALLGMAWASEMLVSRHVRKLTHTAGAIAGGDLSARSEVPYDEHEIGQLAQALDEMVLAIQGQEASLRQLVQDREMLLREVNHRIKNNMQVILAMLQTERRQATSETVKARLSALAGRIQTLADIHRLLHEQGDGEQSGIERYAPELAKLLAEFYGAQDERIRVVSEVGELPLTMDQAVSFGMVLNELISNAQKHAFPGGREGTIIVRAVTEARDGSDTVHLTVSDDGVGIPENADIEGATASTGMRIIDALVRQLQGSLEFERRERGTTVHLCFPVSAPTPESDDRETPST